MTKDETSKEFSIDSKSPYFRHPSNSPGAMITSMKAKNKLGFIHGSITKPTIKPGMDPEELNAWEIVNSMIKSWILNVIDLKLHTSVAYADST